MGLKYELRGAPEAPTPDDWRIYYFQTVRQHGLKHKRLGGAEAEERVLMQLVISGSRGEEKDEARRRAILWDKRYHLYAVLEAASEGVPEELLPVRIEQSHAEEVAAGRGALARKVQGAIEELAVACGVDVGVVRQGPRPQKRGTTGWIGKGLLPSHLPPSSSADKRQRTGGQEVKVSSLLERMHELAAAPVSGRPVAAPLGLMVVAGHDVGRPVDMECHVVRPGTGKLYVSGNVKEDVRTSVHLSLSFLRLHRDWIVRRFGPFHVMRPDDSTADLHVHLCMCLNSKSGTSLGAAITVALAASLLGRGVRPQLALTGQASLSGPLGAVTGLAEKLRCAHDWLLSDGEEGTGNHNKDNNKAMASVIVPADNVRHGRLVERGTDLSVAAVCLERNIQKDLRVLPAATLFDCLMLALVPTPPATQNASISPPANPPPQLGLARSLISGEAQGGGGMPHVVEVTLVKPGQGRVVLLCDAEVSEQRLKEATLRDALEAVVFWVRAQWPHIVAEIAQDPSSSPPPQDPRVLDYDLHINVPGHRPDARLAMAAGIAVLSVLFGRPVPQDMAFVGEVQLSGRVMREATLNMEAELLKLAQLNGKRTLVVSIWAAHRLDTVLQRNPRRLAKTRIIGVADMLQVVREVFSNHDA